MRVSKATETAIAAMGILAANYDGGETRLSAVAISKARKLQRPFVSKVLTELSRAGLVTSARGPGGGFTLARAPKTIYLFEIYALFERLEDDACPFGGGLCGVGDPCPLHDKFSRVRNARDQILKKTTLKVFQKKS